MTQQDMAVKVTDSTESVLDVLHKGRATPGHIVEETSLSRQTVHSQLNQLLAGEHVRYVHEATGLYELVDDPRDDADADQETDSEQAPLEYVVALETHIEEANKALDNGDPDAVRRHVRAAGEAIGEVRLLDEVDDERD